MKATATQLFRCMSLTDDTGKEYGRRTSGGCGSEDFVGHSDFSPGINRPATQLCLGIARENVNPRNWRLDVPQDRIDLYLQLSERPRALTEDEAERGFALSFARPTEEELEALYLRDGYLSRTEYARLRKSGAVGPVLATLTRVDNPTAVLEAYGTGEDESAAAQRAMERWRTEQGD